MDMEYLVVNWKWEVKAVRDTFEECEDWIRENFNGELSPSPYTVIVRRKVEV